MSPPPKITRRGMTVGGITAIAAAIVAGGIFEAPRLFKRRAKGEYADLANHLDNPEQAAIVGNAVRKEVEENLGFGPSGDDFGSIDMGMHKSAPRLRQELTKHSVSEIVASDVAGGQLSEADGWVIPLTLAELCMYAADSI
jgi:hypothetical protein